MVSRACYFTSQKSKLDSMEKAILKTLIYYDIFNFPLKAWEVQKWLVGKKANLKKTEEGLKKLKKNGKVDNQGDYYFLSGRKRLVKDRINREKVSQKHLQTANIIAKLFKVIPWIKLVGVSGSLAMMGSANKDDIDLFIITSKNRIWISRLLLIFLTTLTGLRRKRRVKLLEASGQICINLILEIDNLVQQKKNIYLAHEILQMRVLWQRSEIYSKFLHDNKWVFDLLPNWKSGVLEKGKEERVKGKVKSGSRFIDGLENLAKSFQLKIMNSPSGSERIESGALYFHPENKGEKILDEYNKRIKQLLFS